MRRNLTTTLLSLALIAVILPSAGCPHGLGSYTSVVVGVGSYFPDFFSGFFDDGCIDCGYIDGGYVEDTSYFDTGYVVDTGGYYDVGLDGYYGDDWKTKHQSKSRR